MGERFLGFEMKSINMTIKIEENKTPHNVIYEHAFEAWVGAWGNTYEPDDTMYGVFSHMILVDADTIHLVYRLPK